MISNVYPLLQEKYSNKKGVNTVHALNSYFLVFGLGGLFPLPPPEGFPVLLGPLFGLGFGCDFAIFLSFRLKNLFDC
jgi:hypothetical protein